MKSIALIPGTTTLNLVDRPEPRITEVDEIKLRVLEVGICGTDREEVSGGRALAPEGMKELVIGHEMELGYFSLAELEQVRGPWSLPVERDLYFEPTILEDLKALHQG